MVVASITHGSLNQSINIDLLKMGDTMWPPNNYKYTIYTYKERMLKYVI